MKNCHCHTDINLDGSSQLNRFLKALDPSYAPIDDRSIADLLVFSRRYADQIRFYDVPTNNAEDPDPTKISWKEFFRRDMAVIAASIAVVDLQQINKDYNETRENLELEPSAELFAALFNPILGLLTRIDKWYSLAIPDNPLYQDLHLAIESNLKEQVRKMISYEEGFKYIGAKKPLKLDFSTIENDEVWGLDKAVDPDHTIYEGATPEDKIRYAALFVDDIFLSFYGFVSLLVEKSEGYLKFALEQYPAHQPHMTLFITFLQLFGLVQQQMNGLTERILDFYYRDVLRLVEKSSIPDRVHVVFELAKGITEFDLPKGTALDGGKDASDKDQIYNTMADIVVNQAKVKELKTIFVEKVPLDNSQKLVQAIYARPEAKSLDGFGEVFVDPSGKWPTFGKGSPAILKTKNPCSLIANLKEEATRKDQAKVGFAIASPQLLLEGGKRIIIIKTDETELFSSSEEEEDGTKASFEFLFSSEEGWLKINRLMTLEEYELITRFSDIGIINPQAELETSYYVDKINNSIFIYLPSSEQAVINFDYKKHPGYKFQTRYPVMMVMLNPELQFSERKFNSLKASNLSIEVQVGSILSRQNAIEGVNSMATEINFSQFDGLKKLIIQNESGIIDSSNAFDPFTAYPDLGKSFFIGSEEVFNKPINNLALFIRRAREVITYDFSPEWANHFESGFNRLNFPEFYVNVLQRKNWTLLCNAEGGNFNRLHLISDILNTPIMANNQVVEVKQIDLERKPILPVTEWNNQVEKGFIRLDNLIPVTQRDGESFMEASQNLAPQLKIKEISLSYRSRLNNLENDIDQFFHIFPFGVVETYLSNTEHNEDNDRYYIKPDREFKDLDKKKEGLLVNANNLLLPQFTFLDPLLAFDKSKKAPLVRNNVVDRSGNTPLTHSPENSSFDYSRIMAYGSGLSDIQKGLNQYSGHFQEEGMLFIGLENLKPLQSVSLLFHFVDGSAEDEDNDPPPIHWSYLSNDEWKPLKGENLVSDSTFGFQTTGIIKIDVPADATNRNNIITDGLIWFCASVSEHSERIPQLVDVIAQAMEATFIDIGNDSSHFANALPAGSIGKLTNKVAEIKTVTQPFSSFDGKKREEGREYYTRVSERLRHKGRAITTWDYEHLVLDRFPGIYKVKCIPSTDPNCLCRHAEEDFYSLSAESKDERADELIKKALSEIEKKETKHVDPEDCCDRQIAPGHVLIVPISNFKNRNAVNPLQPKTSRKTLIAIEEFIKKRTSPFVKVHAKNPVYEQIIVAFRVKFYDGMDKGYHLKKLNEEIVRYLTPWAFEEDAEVTFGQKIYASSIINFIEERPYVDFITDFFMLVCKETCCSSDYPSMEHEHEDDEESEDGEENENDETVEEENESGDAAEVLSQIFCCEDMDRLLAESRFKGEIVAKPSTPRSILVSVPKHIIIPFEEPERLSPCEMRKRNGAEDPFPEPVPPLFGEEVPE